MNIERGSARLFGTAGKWLALLILGVAPFGTRAGSGPQPGAPGLAGIQIARGFQVNVIASAPSVENPVAFAFDENGRPWVAERPPDSTSAAGRIRLLEDPDEAGVYRSSTVISENVSNPTSLACYGGGVFVTATPEVLYLKPGTGAGSANHSRQVVFAGFNTTNSLAEPGALLHGLHWGLENRFFFGTAGLGGEVSQPGADPVRVDGRDLSFDPRSLRLELETGTAGTGLAFDDWARRYVADQDRPLRRPMYHYRQVAQNPFVAWPDPMHDLVSPAARIFTLAPLPAGGTGLVSTASATVVMTNTAYRTVPDSLHPVQSIAIYRGGLFPTNYRGNVFLVSPSKRVVHRTVLRQNGLEIQPNRPEGEANNEFLSSAVESFRPVFIANGPGGALYIADSGTAPGQGRVLCIRPVASKSIPQPRLEKATAFELVSALASSDGWLRDTAARLLFERRDPATIPLLSNMLNSARMPTARLHALGSLAGLGALTEAHILKALKDLEPMVRHHALRLLETPPPGGLSPALRDLLRGMANENSPDVRRQLPTTLAQVRHPAKVALVADILGRDITDPWVRKSVLAAVNTESAALFGGLAANPRFRSSPIGHTFLLELAAMIGTVARPEEVDPLIGFLSQAPGEPLQYLAWIEALGKGLRNAGGSLADPRGRLQPLYGIALETAINGDVSAALRAQALRVLGASPATFPEIGDWVLALTTPAEPLPVLNAAIEVLSGFNEPRVYTELRQRWADFSPAVRAQMVQALLSRVERAGPVLLGLESGRPALVDFSPVDRELLRNHPNVEVAGRARQVLGPTEIQRPLVLKHFQPALKLTGAPNSGRQTFAQRCASCHTSGTGQGVELTRTKVRPSQRLLTDILEPSRQIPAEWTTYVAVTRNGQLHVGTLESSNPEAVVLRKIDGSRVVLPRNALDYLERQPWSMMPAGLEQGLSPQAIADVIAFLKN